MPLIQNESWQLVLLLAALPLQYFVVQYYGSTSNNRDYNLYHMISELVETKSQYLEWNSWSDWFDDLLFQVYRKFDGATFDNDHGESPALEVIKFKDKKDYFGGSKEPRSPRPPYIRYKIGQVIKHKKFGYRGVIIGWDKEAKAPESWIKEMHGKNKHYRKQPNYVVLVDTRDRQVPQMTYIPQDNIEIISNFKVIHVVLEDYFEKFDGTQYLPRPWLKNIYPYD